MADAWGFPPSGAGDLSGSSSANAMDTANTYTWIRSAGRSAGDRLIGRGTLPLPSAETSLVIASSGTKAAFIEIIGADSSWTLRAAKFIIEGASGDVPSQIINCSTHDYWRLDHVHVKDTSGDVISCAAANVGWELVDCIVEGGGGHGIDGNGNDMNTWRIIRTIIRNNAVDGINDLYLGCIVDTCLVHGNGGAGILVASNQSMKGGIINSILSENTNDNIRLNADANIAIIQNTLWGSSAGSGILLPDAATGIPMLRNRICGNNQYAIEVVTAADVTNMSDYNYTHGNIAGAYLNQASGIHDVAMAAHGMVSPGSPNHDYRLISAAQGRRVPVLYA